MVNVNLGKELIKRGFISLEKLQNLIKEADLSGKDLEEVLLTSGELSEEDLYKVKADVYNVKYIDLTEKEIPQDILKILPEELAKTYQMIVFDKKENKIKVALARIEDLKAKEVIEYIARRKGFEVEYYLTSPSQIKKIIPKYHQLSEEVTKALKKIEEEGRKKEVEEFKLEGIVKGAPVSKIVNVILVHAVEGGASDIHIEPMRNFTRVRYRVDGELKTTLTLPKHLHNSIISRIKVLSNLKLDETRKPQDGRIRMEINDKPIDFRVSILPLQDYEKAVLRVLDTSQGAPSLEDLGYRAHNLKVLRRNIMKPNGIILITGPTGSGKSKTLFSILSKLNQEDVNISTLEDPVEYKIEGVNQSQIRPEVGFTFASGLRALLRQDPDIIMVGEIRDNETAELAIHAALTGHLVLSTLHTNDAIGAIPRLIDMHIEPFLIASSLNMVVAQRLVRKICKNCKEEYKVEGILKEEVENQLSKLDPKVIKEYGVDLKDMIFYRGKGCAKCGNSGYSGRTSISEVFEITPNMKEILLKGWDEKAVEEEMKRQKFVSMRQDGFLKAKMGWTTLEEVISITKKD